jgi:hypothetical protein
MTADEALAPVDVDSGSCNHFMVPFGKSPLWLLPWMENSAAGN